MSVYSYARQVKAVVATQLTIIGVAFAAAYIFWTNLCDDTLASCIASGGVLGPTTFLLLAAVRPFVFTPLFFIAIIGGRSFGPFWGAVLTTLGSTLSCVAVFVLFKYLGKRLAKPWLRSNLPATFKFIRSQDYKIVFASRLLPVVPFDLASALFGALDFRLRSVTLATLIGTLPEAYLYAKLVDPNETLLSSTMSTLSIFAGCIILPLLAWEFLSRKKGGGMWQLMKAMAREIQDEVRTNNDIVRRHSFDKEKTPVLLLYGFFSSRRSVTVLERMLTARGYQVLSFNLGGLMGVFNTRDILETANFIDYKIKRQIERHGFKKIHIVAHSKGGLVALWWALKLGGHKYCDTIITMGTPFSGSRFTYLALVTPLGLIWRDVWQMRPGSMFLRSLQDADVPDEARIYCLHSEKDRVAHGTGGIFRPRLPQGSLTPVEDERVVSVRMNHIGHFEFLYRRDVGDKISEILQERGNAPSCELPARPFTGELPLSGSKPLDDEDDVLLPPPLDESSGFS